MGRTSPRCSTPEWLAWSNMHQRCRDPRQAKWYAGISVCDRWKDYDTFRADVGPRPSKTHSLDRIDSTGNYEPGNVRWATHLTQVRNTRVHRDSKTGVRGVTWITSVKKWHARITANGRRVSLGYFYNIENARMARRLGEIMYWSEA